MGLDMYLEEKVYIGEQYEHREIKGTINITTSSEEKRLDKGMKNLSELVYNIAYWRKANAIHGWITKDSEDDREVEVSGKKLLELVDICKKVKKSLLKEGTHEVEVENYGKKKTVVVYKNTDLADELLSPSTGFFFGSQLYNEWYVQDLDNTIEQLKDIEKNTYYTYIASY